MLVASRKRCSSVATTAGSPSRQPSMTSALFLMARRAHACALNT